MRREVWDVTFAGAGKGEENDEDDEDHDGEEEDAALRAGRSSAEDGFADGVGGEEMVLDHDAAVGHAIEERLGPVP